MRLNRGTFVLLAVSVVVILAVVLLNSQPASAPAPSPEATAEGAGPIFPEIADNQESLVRLEAANSDGTQKTILTKDDGGAWTIAEATSASELATDQTKAAEVVRSLAALASSDRFALGDQQPAGFGLDAPAHIFTLTGPDDKTYTLKIGSKSPTTPRYYAFVNDDTATVYVLQQSEVDNLVSQTLTAPPYVASPTPTATPTATLNPFSEQELATQTAQAVETLNALLTAAAETTAEATAAAEPATPTASP